MNCKCKGWILPMHLSINTVARMDQTVSHAIARCNKKENANIFNVE